MQAAPMISAPQVPKRVITIPDELKTLQKSEVNFMLEKVPSLMKNGDATEFYKLLDLYLEGIITKFEFQDMIEPLIIPSEKDSLRLVITLLSSRESSRRNNKPLLMPLSEYKVRKQDQVSDHYYKFASDYPVPLSTGRSALPFAKDVLNDQYFSICVNTEKFKSKDPEGNKNETNLQKNEEDMCAIDSKILLFSVVNEHLKKEKDEAARWMSEDEQKTQNARYEPRWLTQADLTFIKNLYTESNMRNYDNMLEKLYKNTHKFIEIVQNRIQKRLDNEIEEKKKKLPEWRKCCEQNFTKSLDHLSFIFKQVQKNKSKKSAIEDEIKRIEAHNPRTKSLNELKGGNSAENEFFCSFTNLNMGVAKIYSDESLANPALKADFPINMDVSEDILRHNAHALPQMRFLLNDRAVMQLTA